MTLVRNPNTLAQMREVLQQQSGMDVNADQVVLVAETNPKILKHLDIVKQDASTATGTRTVFTTPSDRDFILTYAQCGYIKDATCDAANGVFALNITLADSATATALVAFPVLTTTAQSNQFTQYFPNGIKLKRGSTITFGGVFTAGAMSRSASIAGYTLDAQ